MPKISCLLVTADRPDLCRRALRAYKRQTYANKELIVLDNGAEPIESLLTEVQDEDVRYMRVDRTPDTVIGGLRNITLEEASGEFIVPQWDDDDWSHPERLDRQAEMLLRGFDACALPGTLMHVDTPPYLDKPFIGTLPRGVPPTIMHRKDPSIRYLELRRTSDTHYVKAWRERRYAQLPDDQYYLYVRHFHGGNLWDRDHFLRRVRNTPADFLAYAWHKYARRDLFGHPRFQLNSRAEESFTSYLDDSYACGLFDTTESGDQE